MQNVECDIVINVSTFAWIYKTKRNNLILREETQNVRAKARRGKKNLTQQGEMVEPERRRETNVK